MKTKYIPLIVMLLAALVVSIASRIMRYDLETTLWIVVLTMVLFFIIGSIYAKVIGRYEAEADAREQAEREAAKKAEEEAQAAEDDSVSDEGEVIEKDVDTGAPIQDNGANNTGGF